MKISAFRPLVYSDEARNYHSPPYDTISAEMEAELKKNPENITHATLPEKEDYSDAVGFLEDLKSRGIMKKLDNDCIVILSQKFRYNDDDYRRHGIIALTSIYPPDGSIKPHERTFDGPKRQRLNLMSALKCQPEPIFLLVSNQNFLGALKKYTEEHTPDRQIEEPIGVVNDIFFVKDEETIRQFIQIVEQDNSIVADGHHRLAATMELAELSGGKWRDFWGSSLSYITSVSDSGLLIGGIHRCLGFPINMEELLNSLKEYFTIVDLEKPTSLENITLYHEGFHELKPDLDKIAAFLGKEKDLLYPAIMVREIILKKALSLEENVIEEKVKYIHDSNEAIRGVDEKKFSLAILLPSWDKYSFIRLIMKGEVLTQKSTYFYPKPPSGIVLNCYSQESS